MTETVTASTTDKATKAMVVFSDGTGNRAAKLFETNVWRIYRALDLTAPQGVVPQITYDDNGVGTLSFKPLAFLGGTFGWELK